jgi:solute:Na+ symporter, SSS family
MAVTLLFEWIGGMRCVAMTDCIQASIMITAYVCLPIIIVKNYGGWAALDPNTYPRPDFYQTPSWEDQMDFWQFVITCFTFFTLPHLMQRTYAAKDLLSLKCAYVSMTIGAWLLMFTGVFIGTVGVSILADKQNVTNPLTAILEEVMGLGGFPLVIGLLTFTASLAAIMSTVDSLLVAISQVVTEEIAYPLYPNASPNEMTWCGRAVSFAAVVFSTALGYGVLAQELVQMMLPAHSHFLVSVYLFSCPYS